MVAESTSGEIHQRLRRLATVGIEVYDRTYGGYGFGFDFVNNHAFLWLLLNYVLQIVQFLVGFVVLLDVVRAREGRSILKKSVNGDKGASDITEGSAVDGGEGDAVNGANASDAEVERTCHGCVSYFVRDIGETDEIEHYKAKMSVRSSVALTNARASQASEAEHETGDVETGDAQEKPKGDDAELSRREIAVDKTKEYSAVALGAVKKASRASYSFLSSKLSSSISLTSTDPGLRDTEQGHDANHDYPECVNGEPEAEHASMAGQAYDIDGADELYADSNEAMSPQAANNVSADLNVAGGNVNEEDEIEIRASAEALAEQVHEQGEDDSVEEPVLTTIAPRSKGSTPRD